MPNERTNDVQGKPWEWCGKMRRSFLEYLQKTFQTIKLPARHLPNVKNLWERKGTFKRKLILNDTDISRNDFNFFFYEEERND